MKNFRIAVLILLIAIATPFALHRRAWALHRPADGKAASAAANPVHIISPLAGEELGKAYAVVQYRQVAAKAASSPNYELRLDGRDPIQTTETNYTFNGLKPGSHNVVVQVVDANGAPIPGTQAEVHFTVSAIAANATGSQSSNFPPLPQPIANDLPNGNGSLPLLSIIGFGILVGGVISALRTRPAHK
jgi:hypothetical protein